MVLVSAENSFEARRAVAATVDKTAEILLTFVPEFGIHKLLAPRRTWLETVPGGVFRFMQFLLPISNRLAGHFASISMSVLR